MYNPIAKIWSFDSTILWIDLVISIALIAFIIFVSNMIIKRKSFFVLSIVTGSVCLLSWFFGLTFVWELSLMFATAYLCAMFVLNQNELKGFLSTIFTKKASSKGTQKVYDRHAVCQKVALAVEALSKSKTGALITFEKEDLLTDVSKSGTTLNSPITPELLITIFYPGTRLHDGAVVIRRDEILAASVYYTPTTKPLTGKFGSRHRAAIGISEITDSVTVVVSEETGRVSLAYKGELIPVAPDSFLRTVEEYLLSDDKDEKEGAEEK